MCKPRPKNRIPDDYERQLHLETAERELEKDGVLTRLKGAVSDLEVPTIDRPTGGRDESSGVLVATKAFVSGLIAR